jgi:hypothetical protein
MLDELGKDLEVRGTDLINTPSTQCYIPEDGLIRSALKA